MFGTLGGPELFLIFVVGLVVFGPRKLPEIGKSLGKMIAEFKRASAEFQKTVEDEVETEKLKKEIASAEFGGSSSSEPPALVAAPVIREAEGTIPSSAPASSPLAELSEEAGLPPPEAVKPTREGEEL